jgi:hypothetical protein
MELESEPKPGTDELTAVAKVWWRECQVEPESCCPSEEPAEPSPGQMWYDPVKHIHYVWDGFEWEELPED